MQNEKQEKLVKIITATVVSVVVLLSIILVYQFISIANLRNKEQTLNTQLETLEEDIYNYSQENAYLQSPEFFEDYAREVLGWQKTNETKFK